MIIQSDKYGIGSGLPSLVGQSLRKLRANEPATGIEFGYDGVDVINVEEARSDIRSTTRAGYSVYDSYPGLQALIDAAGNYKVFYFPANGIFNLSNNVVTKSQGQHFTSAGCGAGIKNGGFSLLHEYSGASNLYLFGEETYGIYVAPGTGTTLGPQTENRFSVLGGIDFFNPIYLSNLHIADKQYGIYNNYRMMYGRVDRVRITECNTAGVYISMLDSIYDWGDWNFSQMEITKCQVGMHIVKAGGTRIVNSKIQSCLSSGLLLEPTTAVSSSTVQGTYITGSCFEDNAGNDVKITAQTGVASSKYPQNTVIVGGTIHKLVLDKCNFVSLVGVYTNMQITQNITATNVVFIGCPASREIRTGSGTSYLDMGMDSAMGAYIKVGSRLTLIDSLNPSGKYL
ncbi:MAG: hypothetical protein A2W23_01245 [Planctomycetes bacterium RBG_16_43_13]|nr:MAG: hypothetical protein A2W23_01245 [Planctomycetes bacterium RBG_16_43_13]